MNHRIVLSQSAKLSDEYIRLRYELFAGKHNERWDEVIAYLQDLERVHSREMKNYPVKLWKIRYRPGWTEEERNFIREHSSKDRNVVKKSDMAEYRKLDGVKWADSMATVKAKDRRRMTKTGGRITGKL